MGRTIQRLHMAWIHDYFVNVSKFGTVAEAAKEEIELSLVKIKLTKLPKQQESALAMIKDNNELIRTLRIFCDSA